MLSKRISQSKKVNSLQIKSQIVWTWNIPYLDDYGCYTGDSEDIKTEVFPKNKKISQRDIEKALNEETKVGLLLWYIARDGELVQQYTNFDSFQTFKSDRPRISQYPQYQPDKEGIVPIGNQGTPEGSLSKVKVSQSKIKLSKDNYSALFKDFWKDYPTRWIQESNKNVKVGKSDAWEQWQKLSPEQHIFILKILPVYKRQIDSKIVPDAWRWLRNGRYNDYEIPAPTTTIVQPEQPKEKVLTVAEKIAIRKQVENRES